MRGANAPVTQAETTPPRCRLARHQLCAGHGLADGRARERFLSAFAAEKRGEGAHVNSSATPIRAHEARIEIALLTALARSLIQSFASGFALASA
jgi:hypothetical protein